MDRLTYLAVVGVIGGATPGVYGVVTQGPIQPYASVLDSPLVNAPIFEVEDFQDGVFNLVGASLTGGTVFAGAGVDSVDGDDGVVDGISVGGQSLFIGVADGFQATVTFDAAVLGELPSYAGFVFTDGGPVTLTAFDGAGEEIASVSGNTEDGVFGGTVADDALYWVFASEGIGSIQISSNTGIEVDHVQFAIPAPGAAVTAAMGLGMVGRRRRR